MATLVAHPAQLAAAMAQARSLPPLREELSLYPGPCAGDGSSTWTLHDPVAQRFFRIGRLEFELLSRWSWGDAAQILADLRATSTLAATPEDLEHLTRFLATHNLVQSRGPQALERLLTQARGGQGNPLVWLIKNYLFFRIPLLRPDRFLDALIRKIAWLWSTPFLLLATACGLTGFFLIQRRWETFVTSFSHLFALEGMALMGLALALTKILHEFGHACTAKRHGCRVSTMGVAFMVLWPVLYTDTTDAWKLRSRRQRLAIGVSGIAVELVIASFAILAWSFLPDGMARSLAFLLATTTWILTLAINLNPFMRFDGYYLLSDALGIANLQERSFALARWRLREGLFGFGDPAPEYFPAAKRRFLILYAFAVWIYRFFLFLGIALTVYHLFFKVLGIILMAVEILWFIGKPVAREVGEWRTRAKDMRMNRAGLRTLMLALLGAILLFFPWQGKISAPALWRAQEHGRVYVPQSARVAQIATSVGQQVARGDTLFLLESPDLDQEIEQGERRIANLRWAVDFQGVHAGLQERSRVTWQELEAEISAQQGRLRERELLNVRSPLDGVVVERMEPLQVGDWLGANELLAVVITPETATLEAYVRESDLRRVTPGARGTFYPEDVGRAAFAVWVEAMDAAGTRALAEPWMGSMHGGEIAVRQSSDGVYVPEIPVYRLLLEPAQAAPAPAMILRGVVRLESAPESLAARLWRRAAGILIRESGF